MEPEEESVKANLQAIGRNIQSQLPGKHWGFIILTFPFGTGGQCLYLANCQRSDAIQALKEFIAKNAGNPKAFSDQDEGTGVDQAFNRWWATETERVKEQIRAMNKEELAFFKQMATDAFISGMVWSVTDERVSPKRTHDRDPD